MHPVEESVVRVQRFVSRRVTNGADAADISQQALMLACAKFSTFRGDNLLAWLLAIARNLIVDHYRTLARVRFVTVDEAADEAGEPALQIAADAVQTSCECRERLGVWREHITQLRLDQQVAILLADTYGYSGKESAVMLHLSVPRFKLLLHGARVRLREVAAGDGSTAGQSLPPACDTVAAGEGQPVDKSEEAAHPAVPPLLRVGVTCRLTTRELLALRARLLEGLGMSLPVLGGRAAASSSTC